MRKAMQVMTLLVALAVAGLAQPRDFAPGTRYDGSIPTMKQVLGHEPGERVTTPEQIGLYLRALHAAAPDRTRLIRYGESWEGRELHALIVGGVERMRQLEEVKSGLKRLAAGAVTGSDPLLRELPVVVALLHGVHGNEISSGEAALVEAWHLLAATGDPVVDLIRREAIVIIDPMQNPDGRARFVSTNLLAERRLGSRPDPDPEPLAAEHDEPWPGGRSNHYLFDLNRDWFAQTQPETRGRVGLLLDWMPQVVVDLHEMGGDSTYYFPPAADPANPHQTTKQAAWLERFGRATARRFDELGFEYFNREVFDAFYPGYGVSWPTAQGAIGMTFEKASARGLVWRRRDGRLLTYRDGAVEHFTAALATLATAAANREQLLRDFGEFRRTAGQGAGRGYVLPIDQADPGQVRRLVRLLLRNGVRVERIAEPVRVDGRTLAAGSFVVRLPQPAGVLVRNLLDPQAPMDERFQRAQEARRQQRLPAQIYDVTAWNLPLLHDVEVFGVTGDLADLTGKLSEVVAGTLAPALAASLPEATVGYALHWGPGAAAVTIAALRAGCQARFLARDFTIDEDGPEGPRAPLVFSRGTVIFRRADNGPELRGLLTDLAREFDASIIPLSSGFVSDGISPGSNQAVQLSTPRVLLLWDGPTSSLSAGWARFVLEQRYGQPVTVVRVASLSRLDLRRFEVVVMPAGDYGGVIGVEMLRRLRDWMVGGGTLVTLGEASRWAATESVGLLETRLPLRNGNMAGSMAGNMADSGPLPVLPSRPGLPGQQDLTPFEQAIQPLRELPESIPGAILRVLLDEDHWLAAGTDREIQALVDGNRIFAPIRLDKGRNVGIYGGRERLLVSGLLWPGTAAPLARTPFLIHQPVGSGHLIAFAEDPNHRGYAEATQFLFINAVLLGSGF